MNPEIKPYVPPRVAAINAQIAASPLAAQGISQAPSVSPTVSTDTLQNVKPMALAQPLPLTSADGLIGAIETAATNFDANQKEKMKQDQELAQLKAKTDSSKTSLMEKLGLSKGQTALTDQEYSATVDPLEKDLKAINQQIFEEQNGLRKRVEALDTQNLTDAGRATAARDLKIESAKYQSDLYVKQLGIQGQYDSAKQIADRKIAMTLEKDKQDLEILKFNYEENKADYTLKEQRQFDMMYADRERALNAKEASLKQFEDTRLSLLKSANEQNAPAATKLAIANAKTTEEAISAAGQYAGDILDRQIKQAQLNKINADIRKVNADAKAASFVPSITNPEAGKYGTAISTILGSGKFTAQQRADVIQAINSGQDPLSVIKNQAKNIMGQTLATQLDKQEQARDALLSLGDQLSQFYAEGGKTDIFTGNFEKITNKLGEVKDPRLAGLATQIEATLQIYRNAISGTAYSEQEGKSIQSIFPGINKKEELNKAILRARDVTFGAVIDSAYRNTLGATYDQLKQKGSTGGFQPGNSPLAPASNDVQEVNGKRYVKGADGLYYPQ